MASERPSLDRYWLPAPPSTSSSLSAVRTQARSFPSPPLRVSRVGQLDAALLDNELEGILGGPVWKALEGIKVHICCLLDLGTRIDIDVVVYS